MRLNIVILLDFFVVEKLHSYYSKEEINAVAFEKLDDENREVTNIAWSREKQPVRNDKHFESLDLLNKSREELGGCIGEIQEDY